jgi:hypothetical protein
VDVVLKRTTFRGAALASRSTFNRQASTRPEETEARWLTDLGSNQGPAD